MDTRITNKPRMISRAKPIATVIAMAADARDITRSKASELRTLQREKGWPIFTMADYAEGSRDAYSYVLAMLTGAFGSGLSTNEMIAWARSYTDNAPHARADDLGPVEGTSSRDPAVIVRQWPVDHGEGE